MNISAFCIDDDITSLMIIEEYCKELKIDVHCYTNAIDAIENFKNFQPHIIITDYYMPTIDGIKFSKKIRELDVDIPIIMFTSTEHDKNLKLKALEAGVNEFLNKPFDIHEFKIRIRNLITLRLYTLERKSQILDLNDKIEQATKVIKNRELETLGVLINVTKEKDVSSAGHVIRVGQISKILCEAMNFDEKLCNVVYYAAQLHDVGKIAIEDSILFKNGSLTNEEFNRIKEHPLLGYEILNNNDSEYLKMGAIIALNHHEKYDGTGYPNSLKGKDIPILGRIVSVADVFDALLMKRSYKNSWTKEEVIKYMITMSGTQFDPEIINLLLANLEEIFNLYNF